MFGSCSLVLCLLQPHPYHPSIYARIIVYIIRLRAQVNSAARTVRGPNQGQEKQLVIMLLVHLLTPTQQGHTYATDTEVTDIHNLM